MPMGVALVASPASADEVIEVEYVPPVTLLPEVDEGGDGGSGSDGGGSGGENPTWILEPPTTFPVPEDEILTDEEKAAGEKAYAEGAGVLVVQPDPDVVRAAFNPADHVRIDSFECEAGMVRAGGPASTCTLTVSSLAREFTDEVRDWFAANAGNFSVEPGTGFTIVEQGTCEVTGPQSCTISGIQPDWVAANANSDLAINLAYELIDRSAAGLSAYSDAGTLYPACPVLDDSGVQVTWEFEPETAIVNAETEVSVTAIPALNNGYATAWDGDVTWAHEATNLARSPLTKRDIAFTSDWDAELLDDAVRAEAAREVKLKKSGTYLWTAVAEFSPEQRDGVPTCAGASASSTYTVKGLTGINDEDFVFVSIVGPDGDGEYPDWPYTSSEDSEYLGEQGDFYVWRVPKGITLDKSIDAGNIDNVDKEGKYGRLGFEGAAGWVDIKQWGTKGGEPTSVISAPYALATPCDWTGGNSSLCTRNDNRWNLTQISAKDTPKVVDLGADHLFQNQKNLKQIDALGDWKFEESVKRTQGMFTAAKRFNGAGLDSDQWAENMAGITDTVAMFYDASSMNADLSGWFNKGASSFEQDSDPKGAADNMKEMFRNAAAFVSDLTSWCVQTEPEKFGDEFNFSTGAPGVKDPKWGECPESSGYDPTFTVLRTKALRGSPTVTLPAAEGTVENVDWGQGAPVSCIPTKATCTYRTGTESKTFVIKAIFDWDNSEGNNLDWAEDVLQFGEKENGKRQLDSGKYAFKGFGGRRISALKTLDTSNVTSTYGMFSGASLFNQDLGEDFVGPNVKDTYAMFSEALVFNNGQSGSIGNWDTSGVARMRKMFESTAFQQDISGWDVSGLLDCPNDVYTDCGQEQGAIKGMFDTSAWQESLSDWCVPQLKREENLPIGSSLTGDAIPEDRAPQFGSACEETPEATPDVNEGVPPSAQQQGQGSVTPEPGVPDAAGDVVNPKAANSVVVTLDGQTAQATGGRVGVLPYGEYQVAATARSGGVVDLTVGGDGCSLQGDVLSVTQTNASCTLSTSVAETDTFEGASDVYEAATAMGTQTAALSAPASKKIKVGKTLTLAKPGEAVTNAGKKVTFTVVKGKKRCKVRTTKKGAVKLDMNKKGDCVVEASAKKVPQKYKAGKGVATYTGVKPS